MRPSVIPLGARNLQFAVFLDRDGTINHDSGYVSDPTRVVLLPTVGAAIRRLNERNIPVIVVTNQSGIARGLFTEAQYEQVRARLDDLLAATGASITATYMCPHHPDFTGPCECRKPGTLLFRRAAEEHGLDLAKSFYVGDRIRDLAPSRVLGGTGILVKTEETRPEDIEHAYREYAFAHTLDEAVDRIIDSIR